MPGAVQDSLYSITSEFSRANRLLRADGFERVIRAEKIAAKQFKIFFSVNNKTNARLGIMASKKLLPNAADRNRVKRIIRETFRNHSIKHVKLDLVVMLTRDYSKLEGVRIDNLERLFSQLEDRCAK